MEFNILGQVLLHNFLEVHLSKALLIYKWKPQILSEEIKEYNNYN